MKNGYVSLEWLRKWAQEVTGSFCSAAEVEGRVVLDMPENAPVVDAEPVRHGRRLNPDECGGNVFGPCSECGAWYDIAQCEPDGDFNYCPNCHAKFDAEE